MYASDHSLRACTVSGCVCRHRWKMIVEYIKVLYGDMNRHPSRVVFDMDGPHNLFVDGYSRVTMFADTYLPQCGVVRSTSSLCFIDWIIFRMLCGFVTFVMLKLMSYFSYTAVRMDCKANNFYFQFLWY